MDNKNIAKGFLRLYNKKTGKEIVKNNLVVKNSMHIALLGLNMSIDKRTLKLASWGDIFEETPSPSYYNMTELEASESNKESKQNNTISTLEISNVSHPASKSIKFSFNLNSSTIPDLIDKDIREFGLFFNDIMFSRLILEEEFIFEDWMDIVGEWTIIFIDYYGEFSNLLLNQYTLGSLWNFDEKEDITPDDSTESFIVKDLINNNNLSSSLSQPIMTSEIIGTDYIDSSDIKGSDSILINHEVDSTKNLLKIHDEDQIGLDLDNQFTIWQWFKPKNSKLSDSYIDLSNSMPLDKWVLLSKWVKDRVDGECSYRIYIEREDDNSVKIYDTNSSSSSSSSI
jgi:hypothetical protein